MSCDVFANFMTVGCKAADGKAICAFPDVCFTPPLTPATPPGVPLPYPNTGMAGDTSDGSKTVNIGGKEVLLKDKSFFKKSTGDEAGCAPKKGVVTSKNMGKVFFNSWSMDVKFEGENVVRNLDLTTHNHGSVPSNTGPWPYVDKAAGPPPSHPCHANYKTERAACGPLETDKKGKKLSKGKLKKARCSAKGKACREAQKCMLQPWRPNRCCKGEQGHHLVEAHCFSPAGGRAAGTLSPAFKGGYDEKKAPVVCATGPRDDKEHGALHAVQQQLEAAHHQKKGGWSYKQSRDAGVLAHALVYPECDPACIKKQLNEYHNQSKPDGPACDESTDLRTDPQAGSRSRGDLSAEQQGVTDQATAGALGVGSTVTA